MSRPIVVVGAGPAGLSAALALRQRGRDVVVVERRPHARLHADAGGAYELDAKTLRALDALGVLDAVGARGARLHRFELRSRDERVLQRLDFLAAGFEVLSITRSDLQRALLERASALGLPILADRAIDRLDASPEGASLAIDGERLEAEAILGADGMHSVVRREVFRAPAATDVGLRAVWGRTALARAADAPEPAQAIGYVAREASFVMTRGPEAELLWTLTFRGASDDASARATERLPEPVRSTIAAASQVASTTLFEQRPIPTFRRGRAVLLGDAAHGMTPFLGLGANTAIEDGAALGGLLAEHAITDPSVDAWLAARARELLPRIAEARRMGAAMHASGEVAHAFLCAAIRLTPRALAMRAMRARHAP